jgi:16S rRNA (guanine966-N2)-methyltransferase
LLKFSSEIICNDRAKRNPTGGFFATPLFMRIIGGSARGRKLYIPQASSVRPTSERIKEALFNIVGPVDGKSFLDLFAGTGNVGLEALSRGAAKAVFIEKDRILAGAIERNIVSCPSPGKPEILRDDFKRALRVLTERFLSFDIIFADPPYEARFVSPVIAALADGCLMAADGIFVIQHSVRETASDDQPGLVMTDRRSYGDTRLSFFQQKQGCAAFHEKHS